MPDRLDLDRLDPADRAALVRFLAELVLAELEAEQRQEEPRDDPAN